MVGKRLTYKCLREGRVSLIGVRPGLGIDWRDMSTISMSKSIELEYARHSTTSSAMSEIGPISRVFGSSRVLESVGRKAKRTSRWYV